MKQIINCLLIVLSLTNKFGISQKVAIIGKGLGGSLCSYFLHKTIPGIKIDIYNHQPRQRTLFSGIYFNSHNMYMNDLIKEKNIQTGVNSGYFIIKDGDRFYEADMKNYAGYETFYSALEEYVIKQLQIFKQIYDFQKKGQTFKTVRQLLRSLSLDFENYYINETTESLLLIKNPLIAANPGIQKYVTDELAGNFFNTNVHGFNGLAGLMFSEIVEKMQHVSRKSTNLFIKTLFHKDDKTIENDVSIILRENNQNYVVPQDRNPKPYDFIILATTTAADLIQFEGFMDPVQIFKYRKACILYMTGILSKKFRKISKNSIPICNIRTKQFYMQIPYPNRVEFSITGLHQPSESEISQYVKHPKIKETNYTAHTLPDYSVEDESLKDAKFELAENLYNVQAMHSLNINHELLAIGAKNIVLLIKNQIEEIGTFADKENYNAVREGSNSTVGQTNNQSYDERSTHRERASSNCVFGHRTNQTIDKRKINGGKASSSTVRQRTRQLRSVKSRANRKH